MRRYILWVYWLFVAALFPVGVFMAHDVRDLILPFMGVGLILGVVIYRNLAAADRRKWIFPSGLVLALLLTILHYTTSLLFFPHSPRAAQRLYDACFIGTVDAFGGLLFGFLVGLIQAPADTSPKTMP